MSRWIRVSTTIFDHDLFSEEPFTEREAWLWLISKAAWKPTKHRVGGAMIEVPVGSFFVTLRELQDTWKWGSDYRVRTFLKLLQTEEMVSVEANAGKTRITICNYSRYQNPERSENAQETQPQRSENALKTPVHQDTNTSSLRSEDAPPPKKQKATRLPEDWSLPRAWGQWAVSEGYSEQVIRLEAEKFRDHWISKSGKDAAKLDWFATWRNWIRGCSKAQAGRGPPHRDRTMADAIDDFIGKNSHERTAGTTIDHDGGDHPPNVHLLATPQRGGR
jgi:hypothetical protein